MDIFVRSKTHRPASDRILLINHDFPPTIAGVRRIMKMAQYLPDSGFEPYVLAASPEKMALLDQDSLALVESAGYPVWRTPSPDVYNARAVAANALRRFSNIRNKFDHAAKPQTARPQPKLRRFQLLASTATMTRRMLSLPDDRFPWLATAIPAAEHILKSRAIRYVLTSSYPNSTHLLGMYLKRKFRIHWHADFRDGWTQNPYFADYITPVHRRFNAWLEREVVRQADTITAVSRPIVDHLKTLAAVPNIHLVPNGFDTNDLNNVPDLPVTRFRLVYTGTIFMQRSPESFFAALRGLLDCYPGLNDEFEVIFRSNIKPEHELMIRDLGLDHIVHNWGMGTWKEALALQKSADALLVLEGENPNGHIMLTQKIFEYIATGKPILAVAPPGALADLVRQTGSGVVVHPENVFRVKETLFELFLNRLQLRRNDEMIRQYTRQKQASDLASILRGNPFHVY